MASLAITTGVRICLACCVIALLSTSPVSAQLKDGDTIKSIRGKRKPPPAAKHTPRVRPTRRTASPPRRISRPPVAARPKPAAARPAGIVISRLGGGAFRSIGDALKNVKPGARLLLRAGVYDECINLTQPVEITAETGAEDGTTIVESTKGPSLIMSCDQAVVRGLTLRSRSTSDPAVQIDRGKLLLENCDITSAGKNCVTIRGPSADPLFRHCRIYNSSGDGLLFSDKAHGVLDDCEISGNTDCGIRAIGAAEPQIRNCRIRGSRADGIHAEAGAKLLVEYSDIYGNTGAGASIGQTGEAIFRRTKLHRNRIGLEVAGGKAAINDCDVRDNQDVGVQGTAAIINSRVDTFGGIVAWWPAEGSTQDIVGGHIGTIDGNVTYAPALIGKGFLFDGSQSGIMIPDTEEFRIAGSMTVAAWINLVSYPSFSSQIFFRGDDRVSLDPFTMCVSPAGEVRFTVTSDANYGLVVGFPCPLSQFVHVVGVLDAEAGMMRIYKNGKLANAIPARIKPIRNLDNGAHPGLGIGNVQHPANSNQPFHGIIDEVQLYNRSLTDAEIEALYNRR